MSKLQKNIVALLLLVALAVAAVYAWQKYNRASAPAENAPTAPHTNSDTLHFEANAPQLQFIQIKPVEAFPEPLGEPLNGRVAYDDNHTARVFSPIAGRVEKILTETGKSIKVGEPLLTLDAPDYGQATSDTSKAEADVLRKKIAFERAKQLFEAKGLAQKEVELAESDWQQAQAELSRAKARLRNLSSDAAAGDGKFILRAPIDGVVSERQVNAGSETRPDAASPLFVISDTRHIWVMAELPEQQLEKVKLGQSVIVRTDAYPDEHFTGTITVIGTALDPFTRRIQVRCELDNRQLKLKPEMFARVSPIADRRSSLPRIPNTALFTLGLYSYVFVELSPGVLQRRRVTLDLQGEESYVKDGLKAGERIVTSGALLLNAELSGND